MDTEIWVEKYRPKTLDEVVGQDEVIQRLKGYVERKNIPHLLFAGPPGTGKTATAIALARDIFGDVWQDNFIEMNASVSKDTPIQVKINGRIKDLTFEELDEMYFKGCESYVRVDGLKVLSVNDAYKVGWANVSYIIRHWVPKVLKIKLDNGELELTGNHSVMVLSEDGLTAVKASEIKEGDFLLSFAEGDGTNFLPAKPIAPLLGDMFDERSLLHNNKNRISKDTLKEFLEEWNVESDFVKKLANTDLSAIRVKRVKLIDYMDYVYDVSVPKNEMFFAGENPILLHNSDERGIDVVRHKIKEFARTAPISAPFKIIFLDEADALTADAQAALRRTMEMFSKTCRFILSCNYISRIIEPIQSRCAVFKFRPVPKEAMMKRLLEICENEGIEIDEDALDALIYISEGDFRKAINTLQGAAALGKKITADMIYQISATAKPEEIEKLIETALKGNFLEARDYLDRLIVDYGMSGEDIISQLYREILSLKMDENLKVFLIDKLGEIDFRLTEGSHERIQLSAYLAYLSAFGKKRKQK